MTVVGEEGTSVDDFAIMLEAEFVDSIYLQQNAFDDVDGATSADRQRMMSDKILQVADTDFGFSDKEQARAVMVRVTDLFRNWNYAAMDSDEFKQILARIDEFLATKGAAETAAAGE